MEYLLFGSALALLILGPASFVSNSRAFRSTPAPPTQWLRAYRWRWLVRFLLLAVALLFTYHTTGSDGERYRVYGFPLPAAAFDSRGADYVGLMTPLFTLFNVVIWTTIPDICCFVWRRKLRRGNRDPGPNQRLERP